MPSSQSASTLASASDVVQAAGGIILREAKSSHIEVAIIHRPIRDDWSFPKGKLEELESFENAALREVEEETGLSCQLIEFLGYTEYNDRKDRHKIVAYWAMKAIAGTFQVNEEVDELRWVNIDSALKTLSYERDSNLLISSLGSKKASIAKSYF